MGFFSNFQASDAIDIANLFVKPNSPNPVAPTTVLVQGSGAQPVSNTSSGNNNMMLLIVGVIAAVVIAVLGFIFTRKTSRR